MNIFLLYSSAAMVLFCLGIYGLIVSLHLLRKIIAVNIMAGGVFLFLISVAYRNTDAFPDPVPQAMLLTGIVVALSTTAFAVALARRIYSVTGHTRIHDEGPES